MTDGARPSSGADPSHGNIAEEAAKLAEAVQDWLGERTGRGARDVWASATAAGDHADHADTGAHDPPECRVCPLCRAMRSLGSVNPQVFAHLSDAAVSLGAAMRAMNDPNGETERPPPADDGEA